MPKDFDLIVIGGGAAGLVTAAGASGLGARVALIERHRMGGECLWTGCVPSKALLACARAVADVRAAGKYGVSTGEVAVDFAAVMEHVRGAQRRIEPHDSPERFRSLGVDVTLGTARFVGERTVRVDERTMTGRHIVIASGSRPTVPDIPGLDVVSYYTNETIFDIESLPESLSVIGCGAVGVELAQAFALLGSRVTIIDSADRILGGEDQELVAELEKQLEAAGVVIHKSARIGNVRQNGTRMTVQLERDSIESDALLVAAGRESVLDTLDLDAGGVAHAGGRLVLDKTLRTSARNVWAAGDVTSAPRFTHVADYQARTVIRNALFPLSTTVNYDVVPRVTYAIPELARVGLTEADARARYGAEVRVWRRSFGELDRAVADGQTVGMIKIVTDAKGRILGAHILGTHASSIIAEIALAKRENISLSRIASIMHAYPTYAELVKQTADAFVRSRFTGVAKRAANFLVRR